MYKNASRISEDRYHISVSYLGVFFFLLADHKIDLVAPGHVLKKKGRKKKKQNTTPTTHTITHTHTHTHTHTTCMVSISES
jgi:hypothetical protein